MKPKRDRPRAHMIRIQLSLSAESWSTTAVAHKMTTTMQLDQNSKDAKEPFSFNSFISVTINKNSKILRKIWWRFADVVIIMSFAGIEQWNVCGQKDCVIFSHVLPQITVRPEYATAQQTFKRVVRLFHVFVQIVDFDKCTQTILALMRFPCMDHQMVGTGERFRTVLALVNRLTIVVTVDGYRTQVADLLQIRCHNGGRFQCFDSAPRWRRFIFEFLTIDFVVQRLRIELQRMRGIFVALLVGFVQWVAGDHVLCERKIDGQCNRFIMTRFLWRNFPFYAFGVVGFSSLPGAFRWDLCRFHFVIGLQ